MSKAKKIFNIITTIILIALIVLVASMFFARFSGRSPSVFGLHFYRVATDSMEPTLMVGDVIVVKETPADDLAKGDIVTYKALVGEMAGQEITHRVVTDPEVSDGRYTYQTQGDASGAPLDPKITYDQIVGRFVCKLPIIDKLYSFFLTPFGLIAVVALIIVLFGYEMISLFLTYKNVDALSEEYLEKYGDSEKEETEDDNSDIENKTD